MTKLRITPAALGLVAATACAAAGCAAFHPPPPIGAREATTQTTRPAVWTLPPARDGAREYFRTDLLGDDEGHADGYRVVMSPGRRREGTLSDRTMLPINSFLRRPEMGPEQMRALPKAPLRDRGILIIEIDPPMPLYPARMREGETRTDTANVGCFDRTGHRTYYGTLEREVTAEGMEDVVCPAGTFANCKRLRIALRFRFPWGPRMDVTEYLWLADGLGEVRRIEHISGVIVLFWLEGAYEYKLVSFAPAAASSTRPTTTAAAGPPVNWSRAAVLFDRTFPSPRMSGLYAELVDDQP